MKRIRIALIFLAGIVFHIVSANAVVFTNAAVSKAAVGKDFTVHQAIRAGNRAKTYQLINKKEIDLRDASGSTPLMEACAFGDVTLVRYLLKLKADPNATNKAGATPLMRAAGNFAKTSALVKAGAEVNAVSALGNTALILAARVSGASEAVQLLLKNGADINAANAYGVTPLVAAAASADSRTVRILVESGADPLAGPNPKHPLFFIMGGFRTPLMWTAYRGDLASMQLLLDHGVEASSGNPISFPLAQAAWNGQVEAARLLIARGARINAKEGLTGYTPLHWAASLESGKADLADLLIGKGAQVNAPGGEQIDAFMSIPQTPLMLAAKRGKTPIYEALASAGANQASVTREPYVTPKKEGGPLTDSAICAAISPALPLLKKTAAESKSTFITHGSKQQCTSCHQQSLPLAALSAARAKGIAEDPAFEKQLATWSTQQMPDLEMLLQATFNPEPAHSFGYALFGLHMHGTLRNAATDAMVYHVAQIQRQDGHWENNLPRPPIQTSDVSATAFGILALRNYGFPGREEEFEKRIIRARAWLWSAEPTCHEEQVYRLLGLAWSGESASQLGKIRVDLVAAQRSDGGWSQLATLESDPYATGQALYALQVVGGAKTEPVAVNRATRYLLQTQLADYTWRSPRRAFPFQPTMQSGFPHGRDSWLSSAATSWAVLALSERVSKPLKNAVLVASPPEPKSTPLGTPAAGAGPIDFARDIEPLFKRSCLDCHGGKRAHARLRVDSRDSLLKGGASGKASIVPGKSGESALIRIVADQVEDLEMPPVVKRDKYPRLSAKEIQLLGAWIDQGAAWGEKKEAALGR
jgi:ankyrin repeat protein